MSDWSWSILSDSLMLYIPNVFYIYQHIIILCMYFWLESLSNLLGGYSMYSSTSPQMKPLKMTNMNTNNYDLSIPNQLGISVTID